MAVTETMVKNACTMRLNNGQTSTGIATVNQSLGTLSETGWDAQKAVNIIDALESLFTKTIYDIRHVQTNVLTTE